VKPTLIIAAALLIAGQALANEPIYITQSAPFLVRMPHSRADFDEMFAVITEAESGETVGGMMQWVSYLAHNEGQTLTEFNPPIRHLSHDLMVRPRLDGCCSRQWERGRDEPGALRRSRSL
jgi:hypothetical protein